MEKIQGKLAIVGKWRFIISKINNFGDKNFGLYERPSAPGVTEKIDPFVFKQVRVK